jgi:hypothetical protein
MRYVLLICDDEQKMNGLSDAVQAERHQAWDGYMHELVAANKLQGGERLRPAATATTVRVQGGQRLLSDGPFAETKEQLGGYFIVEANDLDEAVEWAGKMPHLADGGSVEIRPIWEM